MMIKQNQVHVLLVLTVTFINGVFPTQDPCPGGVATLNTEYNITGDRSNYTGFIWQRPSDDRYVVTCNPRCSPVAGYSATNDTLSTLTIHSVEVNDTGTWKIVDANVVGAIPEDVCHLTAATTPSPTTSPTSSGSTSSDTAITSSSSRLSSSTTPRSTTVNVVEGGVSPGAIVGIVISIVIVLAIIVILVIWKGKGKGKYILQKVGGLYWCRK